tara:strand:- start:604 stop:867 length:264 start_codon:yes stop_codon:yes gene_type:complete
MPPPVITYSGDGYRTHRRIPVTDYTNSALYATSPDAMADMEMGIPTREEQGEMIFQQIRSLMEDGYSQTLTREHAAEIAKYAIKLLS